MGRQQMAIGKTISLVALLALGVVPLAQAETSKPLFIAADMVTGREEAVRSASSAASS